MSEPRPIKKPRMPELWHLAVALVIGVGSVAAYAIYTAQPQPVYYKSFAVADLR